jgi:hypothetical protein
VNGVDNKRLGLDIRQFDSDRVLNVGQKCAGVIIKPLKAEKLGIYFGYDLEENHFDDTANKARN